MDHRAVAKGLLSLLCGVQGLATVAIDLNRTHATNPLWARHARFHVVWQTMTMVMLSGVEIWLVWAWGDAGFWLAAMLAVVSPMAFLVAMAMRRFFGAELSDPNGITPRRVELGRFVVRIDLNVVAVAGALVAVAAMAWMYYG